MALLDLLNEGSFRGAKFLVRTATTTGGRKQVQHDYPNSSKQSIEDLGFKPRSFQMEAIISDSNQHDPRSYFQKRDELLAALEKAGNGTLSHPFFESSFEVTARDYTLNEDMTSLGMASISLTFDYNDIETNPQPFVNSLPNIGQKVSNFISGIADTFTNAFNAVSPFAYQEALDGLTSFTNFTQTATNTFARLTSQTNPFTLAINTFREDVTSLMIIPANLSDAFFNIINSVQGLYDSPDELLQVYKQYFDFGDNFLHYEATTPVRVQTNVNNDLIRDSVQSAFLAYSYLTAGEKEYKTVNEIDTVQASLEAQYQKLRGANLTSSNLKLLDELRTITSSFLQKERLQASDIVSITTLSELPLSILAYSYYAEETTEDFYDTFETLFKLNIPNSNDISAVSGSLSFLTERG